MKVTAIIPCYNQEKYLAACIEAILSQTRPADEVLIINDGSSDRSMEIAARYPGVKIIHHQRNQGLATARNTGYQAASGEVIVYIDSDANADQRLLESLLVHYDDPEVGGVGGRGIEAQMKSKYDQWRRIHSSQQSGESVIRDHRWLWGLCSSYRKSALETVNGFDTYYHTNAEDVDIGYRLTRQGFKLIYTPDAKVYHQRCDDFSSLHKMTMRWYYWGYVARYRNGHRSTSEYYRIVNSALPRNLRYDVLRDHDLGLGLLDISVYFARLYAVTRAWLDCRRGRHT